MQSWDVLWLFHSFLRIPLLYIRKLFFKKNLENRIKRIYAVTVNVLILFLPPWIKSRPNVHCLFFFLYMNDCFSFIKDIILYTWFFSLTLVCYGSFHTKATQKYYIFMQIFSLKLYWGWRSTQLLPYCLLFQKTWTPASTHAAHRHLHLHV